ncbi:GAF domain-containing protein [bacterium CPR1]|nr:GAF domain-containing protein [bacterium CPR1]
MVELIDEAMDYLLEHLKPERALVVLGPEGRVHGLEADQLWLTAPISHQILRQVLESKEALNSIDASNDPSLSQRTSVMLAEIRAFIGVSIRNQDGQAVGLLYADHRVKTGAFRDEAFNALLVFIRQLQQRFIRSSPRAPVLGWEQLIAVRFR